nr:unnamed protein product [Spirometra erinaceieuropaei]
MEWKRDQDAPRESPNQLIDGDDAADAGGQVNAGFISVYRTLSSSPPPGLDVKTESRRPDVGEGADGWRGRNRALAPHSRPPDPHNK